MGEMISPHTAEGKPIGSIKSVKDEFDRRRHVYSTRTAEGFEALHKESKATVLLWMLRFPFAVGSEETHFFKRRMALLAQLEDIVVPILQYGVDDSGLAYVVAEPVFNESALFACKDPNRVEGIYLKMLKAAARVHQAEIVLGDISEDSFVVLENGEISITGVMGHIESGARKTATLPPMETLHFLAPEQRGEGTLDASSDVFALGVYGYRLFTGRYLQSEKTSGQALAAGSVLAPAPSMISPQSPSWVDYVLGRAVQNDPEERFRDAAEMQEALRTIRDSGRIPRASAYWSKGTIVVGAADLARTRAGVTAEHEPPKAAAPRIEEHAAEPAVRQAPKKSGYVLSALTWIFALAIGISVSVLVFINFEDSPRRKGGNQEPPLTVPASSSLPTLENVPELRIALEQIRPLLELSDKQGVAAVVDSAAGRSGKSSLEYYFLLALQESNAAMRDRIERLMLERTAQAEMPLVEQLLSRLLQDHGIQKLDKEALLKVLLLLRASDPNYPVNKRMAALERAFAADPVPALHILSALTVDEGQESMATLLRLLTARHLNKEIPRDLGPAAIIFGEPLFAPVVELGMRRVVAALTPADSQKVLQQLISSGDPRLKQVVREALAARVVAPYRAVLLETYLREQSREANPEVVQSLFDGSVGDLSEKDLQVLGKWKTEAAEAVLLAVCADSDDPSMALDAFDMLAERPLRLEPGASLFAWVKENKLWEERRQFVKAIGILGLIDGASREDVQYAFDRLKPFAKVNLFRSIVRTEVPKLLAAALDNLAQSVTPQDLLPLLSNEDKEVRKATVRALKGINDLNILQGLLRAYEQEKDEEVRLLYQEVHWVVRQR